MLKNKQSALLNKARYTAQVVHGLWAVFSYLASRAVQYSILTTPANHDVVTIGLQVSTSG